MEYTKQILNLVTCFVFFVAMSGNVSAQQTWTVCTSGPPLCNYTGIQDAVNAAAPNDTIEVWNGTYRENVIVNKQLNIYARDGASITIVTAAKPTKAVFNVTADNVNISELTVSGATKLDGIHLHGVNYCNISNNNVSNNNWGLYLDKLSDNDTITNNIVSENKIGIFLMNSSNNIIEDNTVSSNTKHGIYIQSSSNNNIIEDNTVSSNGRFGIYLPDSSNNNKIMNNKISSNAKYGIRVAKSNNNLISNNRVNLSELGIYLHTYSYNNTITNNNVSSNDYGFYLYNSNNNLIYHNNIINNTNQSYDSIPTDNDWHHPTLLEGNYWSDYNGSDDGSGVGKHSIAGDGIGDTLIPHPSSDYDYYPFINLSGWEIPPEIPTPTNLTITYNNDGTITLTWNGSADSYDIYITNNYTAGFNLSNPYANTSNTSWTDEDAPLYNQRYYKVGTNGAISNETVGKFDIGLYSGLNLVSLPLIPSNNSINAVLHQNASFYPVTEIYGLTSSGNYMTSGFYPENPPDYWWSPDNFTTLDPDLGYWFRLTQDYNFTLVGEVPSSNRSVSLNQGMNLVGWTSLAERKLWNAINQSASDYNVTEITSFNAGNGYMISTFYLENFPNYWWSPDSLDTLAPGKGYWFKVKQTFVWSYAP